MDKQSLNHTSKLSFSESLKARYAVTKHHIQFILLSFDAWSDFIFEIPKNILFHGAVTHSLSKVKKRIEIGRSFRDYMVVRSVGGV